MRVLGFLPTDHEWNTTKYYEAPAYYSSRGTRPIPASPVYNLFGFQGGDLMGSVIVKPHCEGRTAQLSGASLHDPGWCVLPKMLAVCAMHIGRC